MSESDMTESLNHSNNMCQSLSYSKDELSVVRTETAIGTYLVKICMETETYWVIKETCCRIIVPSTVLIIHKPSFLNGCFCCCCQSISCIL